MITSFKDSLQLITAPLNKDISERANSFFHYISNIDLISSFFISPRDGLARCSLARSSWYYPKESKMTLMQNTST